jgi:hypothetical protein
MHDIRITQHERYRDGTCCKCGMTYQEICLIGMECLDYETANETTRENAQADSQNGTGAAAKGSSQERTDFGTAKKEGRGWWRVAAGLLRWGMVKVVRP